MTENSTPEPVVAKKSNRSTYIIVILSIVIILQGVKIYFDIQEKQVLVTENATTEQELATTMQRLNEISTELNQKIIEIQKLGGDITELQKAKDEVEAELKRTRRANGQVIKELKDRVEGYEELLKIKDEEIEKLKSVNKELLSENVTLKTEKNELGDSISRLAQSKDELITKVVIASQLKAENISIVAVSERGKERESPFKNRQLGKLKIDFNIGENKVAPIEGKKIMIRIVDQNGQVLFDVSRGSGTFLYNNKEEFYTASQEVLFDNTKQKLTYLYEKGSEYAAGAYVLEIYCDDYLMGSGKFEVK
jgi:regulator of replication initiation timing